jgi:hypothetical protein
MNEKDQIIKNKIIESCAKEYLLYDKKAHKKSWLLKPYLEGGIVPSNRQLREWRIYKEINNKIINGDLSINNDLGIWTPSFCSGIRDSGIFQEIRMHCFKFNKNAHNEFLLDIKNIKFPIKVSKIYRNQFVNITGCPFLEFGVKNGAYNWNEYLGGLFAGCRIINTNKEQWLMVYCKKEMTLKKIITVLDNYKILYRVKNNRIFISPFYGALFFGYMPIHSSTRIINVKMAGDGSKLALVYWNMLRGIGESVAPTKAQILPFAVSYATHWNTGLLKKTDIRRIGIEMGIIGISNELRDLMREWIKYRQD